MQNDRRAILQLVAMGRITPTQAERLLIAFNDGRESMWALLACIVISFALSLNPHHSRLFDLAHSLVPAMQACAHSLVSLINLSLGGTL